MYLKRNNNKEGIFAVISLYSGDYGGRFYLREIARLTQLPVKNIQNILRDLENRNILVGEVRGKNKYFALNLKNIETKLMLMQAEIYKLKKLLGKYPQFKAFLREIKSNIPIIVFGSFAKFNADKNSDVDILVIGKEDLAKHLLPNKIHKISLSEENFIKAFKNKETLIEEINENHIILNNPCFYVNTMWNHGNKK